MTETAGRNQPVMPPGRELDAEVAEKVMGWKRLGDASPHSRWRGLEWVKPDGSLSVTLTFSVEWDAMRLVVERMVAQGYGVEMSIGLNGPGAFCIVTPPDGVQPSDWSETKGETLPHAVSLAALAARKAATSAQQSAEARRE